MYLLFNTLLHVPWPPSLLGNAFPQLRSMLGAYLIVALAYLLVFVLAGLSVTACLPATVASPYAP